MKRFLRGSIFIFLAFALLNPAFGQRQTGSIDGKVMDENKEPIPGVSVTLSGSALMGTRTYLTTEGGDFRFPALSPGIYTITCELSGFKKVIREGVVVSVGKTVSIAIILEPSPIQEEVTVTAPAPVMDVKSTKIGVTVTKELVENLPVGRSLAAVILATPGAVPDRSYGGFMSTRGGVVSNNIYALDGLNIEDPLMRQLMTEVDISMVDEIEMQVGGHPAEVGSAAGAYVNIITRSGGNKFSGTATSYVFFKGLQDKNFSKEQRDSLGLAGLPQDNSRQDFSLTIGGPVIKDRIWFFTAARYLGLNADLIGFPEKYEQMQYFGMAKFTFMLRKNIKAMTYFNYRYADYPYNLSRTADHSRTKPEAASRNQFKWNNFNFQLNWILSQNLFADLKGTYISRWYDFEKKPGATHYNYDRGTGIRSGGINFEQSLEQFRYLGGASFTLFKDNFLGGNHEIKFGAEYEYAGFDNKGWNSEPIVTYTFNESPYYFGGNRGQFDAYALAPTEKEAGGGLWRTWTFAFYLQDQWTIKDRLTLNLGLRYDSSHGFLPEQISPASEYWMWLDPQFFSEKVYPEFDDLLVWNTISPRLGLTFDIFGDGKTIAKTSFSRYRDYLQLGYFYFLNGNAAYSLRRYSWTDTNLNGKIDAADTIAPVLTVGRTDVPAREMIDPDTKAPFWNEFIIGVDHELFPGLRVGVNYVYKQQVNIFEGMEFNNKESWSVPLTVKDPGYDGKFGTSDDAQLTLWDRSKPQGKMYWTNPDGLFRKYSGVEFILEKRWSKRWQLIGSIVYSKLWGTIGNRYDTSIGIWEDYADTPNYYINREGRLDLDRPLVIKLQGSYLAPYDIMFSFYLVHMSGLPWTRVVNVYAPNAKVYVRINAEKEGSRRNPSFINLDLRVEKSFSIGRFGSLGLFVECSNALNRAEFSIYNANQGYIEANGSFRADPLWLKVIGINMPRVFTLGLRFTF